MWCHEKSKSKPSSSICPSRVDILVKSSANANLNRAQKMERSAAKSILESAHKLIAEQSRDLEQEALMVRNEADHSVEPGTVYVYGNDIAEDMEAELREAKLVGVSLTNRNVRNAHGVSFVVKNGSRYYVPWEGKRQSDRMKDENCLVYQMIRVLDQADKQVALLTRRSHFLTCAAVLRHS